ncbi:MAG: hypothetical protein WBW88_07050 [Rhodothermales bacterium]
MLRTARGIGLALVLTPSILVNPAQGQEPGSATRNLQVESRTTAEVLSTLGELTAVALDQSPDRNYAYVGGHHGWAVIDISDPGAPRLRHSSPTDGPVSDLTHFQLDEKTFAAVATDGRIEVFDVTDLTDDRAPASVGSTPGGTMASVFAYRHSSGATLLIVTAGGDAVLYDAASVVTGHPVAVGSIPTPPQPDPELHGYDRAYAAYHAATETDRFYGAGAGGYHVFDITHPDSAVYITSAMPAAVRRGHMVSATPDGQYLLAGAEYRAAPLRIFNLQPALDGSLPVIRTSDGAWTDDWTSFLIAHEIRWPFVFVASGEQGLQIFDMRDPENPFTYGYLRTSSAATGSIDDHFTDVNGAVDVDVRNSDGLIAVVDRQTGLWLVRLEAFQGWDGRGYGMPNISSVQHWMDGPDGTTSF